MPQIIMLLLSFLLRLVYAVDSTIRIDIAYSTDSACRIHVIKNFQGLSVGGTGSWESDKAALDPEIETDITFECVNVRRPEPKRGTVKRKVQAPQRYRISCFVGRGMYPFIVTGRPLVDEGPEYFQKVTSERQRQWLRSHQKPRTKGVCRMRLEHEEQEVLARNTILSNLFDGEALTFKQLIHYELCMEIQVHPHLLPKYLAKLEAIGHTSHVTDWARPAMDYIRRNEFTGTEVQSSHAAESISDQQPHDSTEASSSNAPYDAMDTICVDFESEFEDKVSLSMEKVWPPPAEEDDL
ncbi:hypothetical protein MRB53_040909 [Persea americana]|nr:hypothetical protein MRB53_040909 [Persea americana]